MISRLNALIEHQEGVADVQILLTNSQRWWAAALYGVDDVGVICSTPEAPDIRRAHPWAQIIGITWDNTK
jgi:hypothetical protein